MTDYDVVCFTGLGLSVTCAIVYPMLCRAAIEKGDEMASRWTGITAAVGFIGTLPLMGSREMPWMPYLAAAYFAGATVAYVFRALGRLCAPSRGPRGFEPVLTEQKQQQQ